MTPAGEAAGAFGSLIEDAGIRHFVFVRVFLIDFVLGAAPISEQFVVLHSVVEERFRVRLAERWLVPLEPLLVVHTLADGEAAAISAEIRELADVCLRERIPLRPCLNVSLAEATVACALRKFIGA